MLKAPYIAAVGQEPCAPDISLFAKIIVKTNGLIFTPIGGVKFFIITYRRILPIKRAFAQSVVNRVIMNIIYMPIHIFLISYDMVPKAILPNPAGIVISCDAIFDAKAHFKSLQDVRNIRALGVYQNMKMVRDQYVCDEFKVYPGFNTIYAIPKQASIINQYRSAVMRDIGYEINIPRAMVAA